MCWLIVAMQIPKYLVKNVVVFPFLAQSFAHHKELFEVDGVSYIVISCSRDVTLLASGISLISVELRLSLCALIYPAIYFCISYIFHSQGNIQPPPAIPGPDKQAWDFKHGAQAACD